MMEFLRVFQGEMELTKQMAQRLNELGLLTAKTITISQADGERYLSGFWVVDDQKFAGLDDVRVVELQRAGILRLIELHRASLGNVPRLAAMLDDQRRQRAQQQEEVSSSTDAAPRQAALSLAAGMTTATLTPAPGAGDEQVHIPCIPCGGVAWADRLLSLFRTSRSTAWNGR